MKTLLGTYKYLLCILVILGIALVVSRANEPKKTDTRGTVEFMSDRIVIHPPVKISDEDLKKLDEVLSHYCKELYKIETLEKGKVVRTRGELSDTYISEAVKAEVAKAKEDGLDAQDPQMVPPSPASQGIVDLKKSDELLHKVKAVLKKYTTNKGGDVAH